MFSKSAAKVPVSPAYDVEPRTWSRWQVNTVKAGFLAAAIGLGGLSTGDKIYNDLRRQVDYADTEDVQKADAIIVLTGSNGRVQQGFRIAQPHQILYISGCNAQNDAKKILDANPEPVAKSSFNRMTFHIDHATDTQGNAREIRNWLMRPENAAIDHIVIVTSEAHAPRALRDIKEAFADMPRQVKFSFSTVRADYLHHWSERLALLSPL